LGSKCKLIAQNQAFERGNRGKFRLDELHQLYGSEPLEEILDGIIERKKRLNRLVELQSKVIMASDEELELQFLRRLFHLYVYRLAMARQMIDQLAILRGPSTRS
jgi:hypothetical protein